LLACRAQIRALLDQAIVLTAHLMAMAMAQLVDGDSLYNGTLDDAGIMWALLIQLAKNRAVSGFARPLIFAIS